MSQTPRDVARKLRERHAVKVAKKTGQQPIQVPSRKRAVESSIEDSEYQPEPEDDELKQAVQKEVANISNLFKSTEPKRAQRSIKKRTTKTFEENRDAAEADPHFGEVPDFKVGDPMDREDEFRRLYGPKDSSTVPDEFTIEHMKSLPLISERKDDRHITPNFRLPRNLAGLRSISSHHRRLNIDDPGYPCTNCLGAGKRKCVFRGYRRRCYSCEQSKKGDCSYELPALGVQYQLEEIQALTNTSTDSEFNFLDFLFLTKFLDLASNIRHIAHHIRNIDSHQSALRDSFLLLAEDARTLYSSIETMQQQQGDESFRHHFGKDVSYESLMTVFHPIFVDFLGFGGFVDTPAVLDCYDQSVAEHMAGPEKIEGEDIEMGENKGDDDNAEGSDDDEDPETKKN